MTKKSIIGLEHSVHLLQLTKYGSNDLIALSCEAQTSCLSSCTLIFVYCSLELEILNAVRVIITFLYVIVQAMSIAYFVIIPLFCNHTLFCNPPADLTSWMRLCVVYQ